MFQGKIRRMQKEWKPIDLTVDLTVNASQIARLIIQFT
jgi:hypothetical protein